MTGTILIIGGRLQAILKAKELGLRVVFLQHKDRLLPGQAEAADAMILVDYLDIDVALPMVRAAHEVFGFTKVVSLVDQAMELVGRINDALGLQGTSYEVAHRLHHKLTMRERLRDVGFESVAAEPVKQGDDVRGFGERHGYPIVVKPVDGTASRGVVVIGGPGEVNAAWELVSGLRGRNDLPMAHFYPVDEFVAEEYIDGPELSVESFSFDGRHVVIAFTDKLTDGVVEMGHAQPAQLTRDDEAALERYLSGFLDAVGLRDGVGHTEIRMSTKGPRIIEGHDRVAGDRVMDLAEAVYGVDLERYAVGWPHRLVPELTTRPPARCGAATRFLSAPSGTVCAVEGLDAVRAQPGVLDVDVAVSVGQRVSAVLDNFDRHGQILASAADAPAAVALCAELVGRIKIRTMPELHGFEPHGSEPHGSEPHGSEPQGSEPHGSERA